MSKIDSNLKANVGDFRFDKNVALQFDSHVRKSVPFYEEIQRMIVEISDWFIHEDSIVFDLGCSVGETIHNLYSKHFETKHPRFIGIDYSNDMLNVARQNLTGCHNVSLLQQDLNNLRLRSIRDASFVTMLYTLQFVRPEFRPRLLSYIYSGLLDSGALIIVEKITGNNPKFNELFIELYNDLKIRNNLTLDQIKAKADSLRGILLSHSQEKNMNLLINAGFKDIDIFFKWYNFIGIIAVK